MLRPKREVINFTVARKKKRLPNFNKMSYEEEATWWDTHDISEYKDEFTDVGPFKVEPGALKVSKHLKDLSKKLVASNMESAINIRLSKDDHKELRAVANKKRIGVATLARMWIIESLQAVREKQSQTL